MKHEAGRQAPTVENPEIRTSGNEGQFSFGQNPVSRREFFKKAVIGSLAASVVGRTLLEAAHKPTKAKAAESVIGEPAFISPEFSDVPLTHPYREAIIGLANAGIINGYEVNDHWEFKPQDTVKRAQFAKMIDGVMELPVTEQDICNFIDVEKPTDNLYPDNYIAVAAKHGITKGITSTEFGPYREITRAQVITMAVRANKDKLATPPTDYKGSLGNFSDTHGENARIAEYNGLLTGLENYNSAWSPWENSTRGECAQVLWNLKNFEKQTKTGEDLIGIERYAYSNTPDSIKSSLPTGTTNVEKVDFFHPSNANQELSFYLVHGPEGLSFSYENPEGSTIYKNKKLAVSMEINPSLFSTVLSFNYSEQVGIDFLLRFSIWGREGNETPAQYEQRVVLGKATELMQNHATNGVIRVEEIKDVLKTSDKLSVLDPNNPSTIKMAYDRALGQGPAIDKLVDSL